MTYKFFSEEVVPSREKKPKKVLGKKKTKKYFYLNRSYSLEYEKTASVNYLLKQGGLNEKEIQLNLCTIFFILIFNDLYLFP